MYKKLAGMTGTAATEAEEFYKIYKLDVVTIPTNKANVRKDHNDVVYKTESAKFKAVADEIEEKYKNGQPVLVGTTSVEKSELLHQFLKRRGIPHEILNAKNHEKEALIIAQAGRRGAVTISTNMAGRGVDIILGGDPPDLDEQKAVQAAGGLHVIGTERHESRRIDNQLRGRAGRQGDPGSSRFYVSLQDDLMRIFNGDQVTKIMDRFGIDESIPLEAGIVTSAIQNAQKKVEGFNFDRRKQLVEYDDVINVHREVVYKLRRRLLEMEEGNKEFKDWFLGKLQEYTKFTTDDWTKKETEFGENYWLTIVVELGLPVVDLLWMEHLVDMDQVREGIGLRGYAQRDPMVEYKREGHERFGLLVQKIYTTIADRLSYVSSNFAQAAESQSEPVRNVSYKHSELQIGVGENMRDAGGDGSPQRTLVDSLGRELKVTPVTSRNEKIGRNDLCFCGSGKKYKNCHGKE
jgi:preprotein translocase subunit SecA